MFAAINPLSTIRARYGNSELTPEAPRTCKAQQNPLQKRSRYGISEFQYRPQINDTDTIADAVFADAASETSNTFFCESLRANWSKRFQTVFLSDSWLRHATEEIPRDKNPWKYNYFQAFWCLLLLRILTTLWTPVWKTPFRKHRLLLPGWFAQITPIRVANRRAI